MAVFSATINASFFILDWLSLLFACLFSFSAWKRPHVNRKHIRNSFTATVGIFEFPDKCRLYPSSLKQVQWHFGGAGHVQFQTIFDYLFCFSIDSNSAESGKDMTSTRKAKILCRTKWMKMRKRVEKAPVKAVAVYLHNR